MVKKNNTKYKHIRLSDLVVGNTYFICAWYTSGRMYEVRYLKGLTALKHHRFEINPESISKIRKEASALYNCLEPEVDGSWTLDLSNSVIPEVLYTKDIYEDGLDNWE